jgi:hypothetical protein
MFVLAAGCGGAHGTRPIATHGKSRPAATDVRASAAGVAASAASAPQLVFFKRAVGVDPLASQLTVYRDAMATAVITLGGANGGHIQTFPMSVAQFRRLSSLLRHARLRNTGCCDVGAYIYWVIGDGRSARLEQHEVPRDLRPLIEDLNAITDAHTTY